MTDQKFKIIFKLYHAELFAFIKATMGSQRKSELIALHCFVALILHDTGNPKNFLFDQAEYECKDILTGKKRRTTISKMLNCTLM